MLTLSRTLAIALLCTQTFLAAAEGPALDATKYAQDTPQHTIGSIIKALEAKDQAYWYTHLITPSASKLLVEKHGSIEKVVASKSDEKYAIQFLGICALMKTMLEANKITEGKNADVPWVRFHHEESILQLEKQPDGRWCMNPAVKKE